MKKISLFLAALWFIFSCRPTGSDIESPVNSKFFDSENYTLLKGKPDSIQVPVGNLQLITAVKADIKKFDNDLHFSDRFLAEHGLPLWKLSIPIPGVKENKVLIPVVKEGSDFVGELLYAIQGENKEWRYNLLDIKTFLREIISSDSNKEKYLEQLVNFSFLILNQKVSGVTVPCSIGANVSQLSEMTVKQLKAAKTTECVTVTGWDGYCMWGGTADNPYQYFNGCEGTYISTQVCYDNPDAFWAHYTGQALGLNTGAGGPPPPAGEDFTLPGVTYDASQITMSQVDCSSFRFIRTTSAGQEAAIRFNLKFIGKPSEGDPKVMLQYKYFKVQMPYETWDNRIIESGEAANHAARAFNGAWSDAIETYKLYKNDVKLGVMTLARFNSEIQREFERAYKARLIESVGSTGISIAHSYTASSPVLARDVVYSGMFGSYNCD